jgi:hypothetical protein
MMSFAAATAYPLTQNGIIFLLNILTCWVMLAP